MDTFFRKVDADTWVVKVSDVVEQNGGGCSFAYLPRTKSLRVSITIDHFVEVDIYQGNHDKYSIQVVRDNNTTMVDFKCCIDPDSKLAAYDYPQSAYYTYLSGYIYIKQDCKFNVHISFIDQQDRYIVNEDREFSTSKFFAESIIFETSKKEIQCMAGENSKEEIQCVAGLKNKIGKWSSKFVRWWKKIIN